MGRTQIGAYENGKNCLKYHKLGQNKWISSIFVVV